MDENLSLSNDSINLNEFNIVDENHEVGEINMEGGEGEEGEINMEGGEGEEGEEEEGEEGEDYDSEDYDSEDYDSEDYEDMEGGEEEYEDYKNYEDEDMEGGEGEEGEGEVSKKRKKEIKRELKREFKADKRATESLGRRGHEKNVEKAKQINKGIEKTQKTLEQLRSNTATKEEKKLVKKLDKFADRQRRVLEKRAERKKEDNNIKTEREKEDSATAKDRETKKNNPNALKELDDKEANKKKEREKEDAIREKERACKDPRSAECKFAKKVDYNRRKKTGELTRKERAKKMLKRGTIGTAKKLGKGLKYGTKNILMISLQLFKFALMKSYKIIVGIIIISALILAFKQIANLIKKHPRTRFINGTLSIAGKFDKSTGLDIEMADIVSKSLAYYITEPSKFQSENNSDLRYNLYDKLFNNYDNGIEDSNNLFDLLNKFFIFKDEILQGTIEIEHQDEEKITLNYLDVYYSTGINIPEGLDLSGSGENPEDNTSSEKLVTDINAMFSKPVNMTIQTKLEDDFSVNYFIDCLKNREITEDNNKEYEEVKQEFEKILTTIDNDDKSNETLLKNIFFRNVLYKIILLETDNAIMNDTNTGQLQILERNNILSYINLDLSFDDENTLEIYKLYGPYLHMRESGSQNVELLKNIGTLNKTQTLTTLLNLNSIDSQSSVNIGIIENRLFDDISNKIQTFENNFNTIENRIFENLNSNYETDHEIKQDTDGWNDVYDNYKNFLTNNGENFDTGHKKLNEIYNLSNDLVSDEESIISIWDKNSIQDRKIKSVLEIFNMLLIFENFFTLDFEVNINENTIYIYDNLITYLWYFEYFTILTYYNEDIPNYQYILNPSERGVEDTVGTFLNPFKEALKLSLYERDSELINSICYFNIKNKDDLTNKLTRLSGYYLSFMEIKLFSNFINDIKDYKEFRTGFNIQDDYWFPKVSYLWNDIIYEKIIKKDFTEKNLYQLQFGIYTIIRDFLGEECNFIVGDAGKVWGCDGKDGRGINNVNILSYSVIQNVQVEEHFIGGALKGIIKPFFNAFRDLPVIGLSVKLLEFTIVIIDTLTRKDGFKTATLLFFGMILSRAAEIIRDLFFTMPLGGIATGVLYVLVMPFIFILILFKSSVILIIIAIISIICIFIILADRVIETLSTNNDNVDKMDNPMKNSNVFSKFIYKNFLSCENSPHSWYKNSRFDLENKSSRGFFCNKPCKSNYRLSEDKGFCEKAPSNIPYYCPQSLVFRHFRKEDTSGKYYIQEFLDRNNPLLLLNNNNNQKDFIDNFSRSKTEYYETCQNPNNEYFQKYNVIGKNICAYGYDGDDINIKKKIGKICKQTYCENGQYENFCYKYENVEKY